MIQIVNLKCVDMLTSSPLKLVIKISPYSNYTAAGTVLESAKEGKQFNHK